MPTWSVNESQTQSAENHYQSRSDIGSGRNNGALTGKLDAELGLDCLFDVLKNQRRRRILRYLIRHDDSVTIGALAEHIAVLENDTTQTALTSRERKRVYIGLYQSHLPKMDDAGAIEFDKARGTIVTGPNVEQFEPYLAESQEPDSWSSYYLLFVGISGLLFTIQSIVTPGFGLSLAQLLPGILCGFSLLSIVHLRASGWFSFTWRASERFASLWDR